MEIKSLKGWSTCITKILKLPQTDLPRESKLSTNWLKILLLRGKAGFLSGIKRSRGGITFHPTPMIQQQKMDSNLQTQHSQRRSEKNSLKRAEDTTGVTSENMKFEDTLFTSLWSLCDFIVEVYHSVHVCHFVGCNMDASTAFTHCIPRSETIVFFLKSYYIRVTAVIQSTYCSFACCRRKYRTRASATFFSLRCRMVKGVSNSLLGPSADTDSPGIVVFRSG